VIPAALVAVCLGQLTLRGGAPAPPGEVVGVTDQGVQIGQSGEDGRAGVHELVPWDRVRAVGGAFADEAVEYEWASDAAWRARTRLARGDAIAAEPLFMRLFERYRRERGPLSRMVAEGLMRCRLLRGAHPAAVEPWLVLVRTGAGEQRTSARATLGGSPTALVPALPPIWLDTASVRAFAGAGVPVDVPGLSDDADANRALELAELYHHAACWTCRIGSTLPQQEVGDAEVLLVRALVVAQTSDDAGERDAARRELRKTIERVREPWVEAWCRVALGRSLLRESDTEQRLLGVVDLLHLPARLGRVSPYLTGIALAEAADALEQLGDTAGAATLRREFAQHYSDHPAALLGAGPEDDRTGAESAETGDRP